MLLENLLHLLEGWAPAFRQKRTCERAIRRALPRGHRGWGSAGAHKGQVAWPYQGRRATLALALWSASKAKPLQKLATLVRPFGPQQGRPSCL